ncbi:hypothetical protein BKA80DRAFT_277649 [Phyllosticta citrichinensis]
MLKTRSRRLSASALTHAKLCTTSMPAPPKHVKANECLRERNTLTATISSSAKKETRQQAAKQQHHFKVPPYPEFQLQLHPHNKQTAAVSKPSKEELVVYISHSPPTALD